MLRRPRSTSRAAAARLLATAVSIGACRDPVAGGDRAACRQTYEFGNYGCFEVEGQVVGSAGQALPEISVGPRYLSGREVFNTAYATTDAAGQFRLRLMRVAAPPPTLSGADTVSIVVLAADPRSAGVGIPARIRDSVLTLVTVAPLGAAPVPVTVRITLPVP